MRLQDRPRAPAVDDGHLRRRSAGARRGAGPSPSPASTRRTAGCSTRARPRSNVAGGDAVGPGARLRVAVRSGRRRPGAAGRSARDHGGGVAAVGGGASGGGDGDGGAGGDGGDAAAETWRSSFLRAPYLRDALARMRRHRRDVRDGDDLGSLRGAARRGRRRSAAAVRAGLRCAGHRHLPLHPRLPGRAGALLHRHGAPAAVAPGRAVGRDQGRGHPRRCCAAGGTITHHHAVGRDHRPWYDRQRPDLFAAAAARGQADPRSGRHPQPRRPRSTPSADPAGPRPDVVDVEPDRGDGGRVRPVPAESGRPGRPFEWRDEQTLVVGGVELVARTKPRFDSTPDRFCLVKRPDLVARYLDLLGDLRPTTMVELGIFQGGSVLLSPLVADPSTLVAAELSTQRVHALDAALAARGLTDRVHLAYGVDQADRAACRAPSMRRASTGRPSTSWSTTRHTSSGPRGRRSTCCSRSCGRAVAT